MASFDRVEAIEDKAKTTSHFNPLYSYKSEAHCMNVRRIVGSKAGNPDLDIPKFGVMK